MNALGTITLSGLALASTIALVLGVRGSDVVRINTKAKAGGFAIVTGTLMVAAGGTWASIALGIGDVPTSLIGHGNGLGNPGQGGLALTLTLMVFGPRWKRLVWPALFGIAASVIYGTAGGAWSIGSNAFRMAVAHVTGAA